MRYLAASCRVAGGLTASSLGACLICSLRASLTACLTIALKVNINAVASIVCVLCTIVFYVISMVAKVLGALWVRNGAKIKTEINLSLNQCVIKYL